MAALAGDMLDKVMKLTRASRVGEATALIKERLGIGSGAEAPRDAGPSRVPELAGPGQTGGWAAALERWSQTPGKAELAPGAVEAPAQAKPGSFEFRAVTNEAGTRRYKLYVPKRYDGTPLPLVVMLHGCTQSPDDFAAGTGMNVVADEANVVVAYPEQPQSANGSKCWNWFQPRDQHRGEGEPSLIADIVREVMREVAVDKRKVFVAGLSAGGAQAAVMANAYPDLFAGAGVHSGLACGAAHNLPTALSAMQSGAPAGASAAIRMVPTIVFHGTGDRTVNPLNAGYVAAQAAGGRPKPDIVDEVENGRSSGGVAYTRTIRRDRKKRPVAEIWMLEGAGHAWSGGNRAGSYTDPRGPDASREMVRFFLSL